MALGEKTRHAIAVRAEWLAQVPSGAPTTLGPTRRADPHRARAREVYA